MVKRVGQKQELYLGIIGMFKTVNGGKLPTKGSKYSASVDVYANDDVVIGTGGRDIVPLGIQLDIDMTTIDYNFNQYTEKEKQRVYDNFMKSHYISLIPCKYLIARGLISNPEVINLDYAGEIKMIIHSPFYTYDIRRGDKIGELLLLPHKSYLFSST